MEDSVWRVFLLLLLLYVRGWRFWMALGGSGCHEIKAILPDTCVSYKLSALCVAGAESGLCQSW